MNKEIKVKWLEALRSGKYKQGKQRLRSKVTDRFCCLGVLCDISGIGEWVVNRVGNYEYSNPLVKDDSAASILPAFVIDSSGISQEHRCNLMTMNDEGNKTFHEIANYIEKEL